MISAPKTISLFSICVSFGLAASDARAADWYRWRGPDLNGISAETGWQSRWPDDGPKRLWKASVGMGFSSMSVSQGHVFTMGNDGDATDTVWCLDAASGATVWKHSYACPLDPKYYEGGTSSTPTVDGDRVYSISRKGDLFCLAAADGKVIWTKNVATDLGNEIPTWGFAGSALVQGDTLILNVGSAGLALEKKNGAVVWHSDNGASGYSTPVPFDLGGKHLVAFAASQTIEVLNPADGKRAWNFPWKTLYDVNAADPIISGGKMFVSSGSGHGAALLDISRGKPKQIWENKEFRNHINSSVLWQGYLYGVDDVSNTRYELKCVSWETGEIKWSEPRFGKGSLIIADGKIIGLADKGELYVVEPTPAGFKPISHAQVLGGKCWTTPVLSNGRIYCRNAKGDLVCLDVSGKP
jgi:outer membrane protein assembly factor BamB